MERRFIEESFPIKEISEESSSEKNIRRGHISALHIWWARRPLTASRASIIASLIEYPKSEKEVEQKKNEIIKISKWDNSLDQNLICKIKKEIYSSNNNNYPKILDPFSGGGSISLESLRLGCDVSSLDYNPVAVLIEKCTLEFPIEFNNLKNNPSIHNLKSDQLLKDVKKWSDWVISEAEKELKCTYQTKPDEIPIGFIWAKTIQCQNPNCKCEIPLIRQYWLAKKPNKKISLIPKIKNNTIDYEIIQEENGEFPNKFNPSIGSISKAIATCLICKSTIDGKTVRELFKKGDSSERMIAVVYYTNKSKGKQYRICEKEDVDVFKKSQKKLAEKIKKLNKDWNMNPTPNEQIIKTGGNQMAILHYGMTSFEDLFNVRQKLSLITIIEMIRSVYQKMIDEGSDPYHAKAVTTYIALILNRITDFCNKNARWMNHVENASNLFSRQAISMVWDYFELNPFSEVSQGTFSSMQRQSIKAIDFLSSTTASKKPLVKQHNAADLEFPNNSFDAVFTDPPYYDNIYYSNLSDFFYVWLKRSVGFLYPELFSTPNTPKSFEITQDPIKHVTKLESKKYFEEKLTKSFKEICRVLKPEGIAVIVYAHKSTDGWETLIHSLLDSGLVVTAAWPIHTEMKGRQNALDTASLASSIYMVCRKWKKEPIGFYRDVKKELKNYLNKKLDQLWDEGISGADFFISAIGSAIEVFGKYEKVIDDNDEQISVLKLLDDTREIVTNYAINKVIKGEFSDEISTMTRFYILWRWAYGESKVPFDGASKMAQSVGIEIENEWNKGFIVKEKEFIRVLGPDERTEKELSDPQDLIDILHKTLQIWKKGKMNEVDKFLEEKEYKNSEVFKRVAQAISESLPLESTEKKWLDGFLTGFKSDDSQSGVQSKLF